MPRSTMSMSTRLCGKRAIMAFRAWVGKFNKGKSEARGRSMHSALSLLFTWLLDERWPGVTKF